MEPKFLLQDQHLFAVYKPANYHSVSNTKSDEVTIASWLLAQIPELACVSERPGDAGLVNRLDYETSGIMLGAKTKDCWFKLRKMIQNGEIEKSYRVLVEGQFPVGPVKIRNYIGSDSRSAKKVKILKSLPKNKKRFLLAESEFSLVEYDAKNDLSWVSVRAHTARRHQVRAHAAFLGYPLVGDLLYGSLREGFNYKIGPCPSFCLIADTVEFKHPFASESITLKI